MKATKCTLTRHHAEIVSRIDLLYANSKQKWPYLWCVCNAILMVFYYGGVTLGKLKWYAEYSVLTISVCLSPKNDGLSQTHLAKKDMCYIILFFWGNKQSPMRYLCYIYFYSEVIYISYTMNSCVCFIFHISVHRAVWTIFIIFKAIMFVKTP